MSLILEQIVAECENAQLADPLKADATRLRESLGLVQAELEQSGMATEVVHTAFSIYLLLEEHESCVQLLKAYLSRRLPLEEEAWARWNLVDRLAVLRRSEDAVEAQQAFLVWAKQSLSQSLLCWVMHDGSQALCWEMAGLAGEWLETFHEIMQNTLPTPQNRFWRFQYLRTAGTVLSRLGKTAEALTTADAMAQLAEENGSWLECFTVKVEALIHRLRAYGEAGNMECCLEAASQARALTDQYVASQHLEEAQPVVRSRPPHGLHALMGRWDTERYQEPRDPAILARIAYHNIAAELYFAGQYSQAIPLFERAMDLKTASPHCYLWHAASVWATTKDRPRVLSLLRRAAPAFRHEAGFLRRACEFEDVAAAPDFLAAVSAGALREPAHR